MGDRKLVDRAALVAIAPTPSQPASQAAGGSARRRDMARHARAFGARGVNRKIGLRRRLGATRSCEWP